MPWCAQLGMPERSVGRASRARQDCLRSGRAVAEGTVRPDGVVVAVPAFDQNPGFVQGAQYLPVQEFIVQLAVEALIVAVLLDV